MPTHQRHLTSLDATDALARDLAAVLRAGDIVRLEGELGAGKTTLVRAIVQALGIDPGIVSSPTYVLANDYPAADDDRPGIAHLDCYRMSGPDELDSLGWDTIVNADDRIILIEWPERIEGALPEDAAHIKLEHSGESSRFATIQIPRSWSIRVGVRGLEARADTTCPVTGERVPADSPSWPFSSDRARMSDLHGWLSESYTISRPAEMRDLEEGVD